MSGIIRVLVVDDSAYVRKVVKQMLGRSPFIEVVGAARNGEEALELAAELTPDVITCDLNMPTIDGVSFVRAQMARKPVPILIMSIASQSGEQVLAALDAGAIDFLQKPTALATDKLLEISDDLIAKVKAAAFVDLRAPRTAPPLPSASGAPSLRRLDADSPRFDIAVLGTSTGGPQGLKSVIPLLPTDFPVPVAIVLHMPVGYTEMYAQRLNEISPLPVTEAHAGDIVAGGRVFVAPAGRHLKFRRDSDGTVRTWLDMHPLDTPHRPSVDAMFQSAAEVYGGRVLGVVMTGMGADGREGAAWIKAKGGEIVTEAEETCVVYGMPRSVDEAGLSDQSVRLDRIAQTIMDRL